MTEIDIEAHSFEHHWDEHNYRSVSVQARLGDNSNLEITEEYDPAIETVEQVIDRCAEDLLLLIKRRGRS